MTRKKTKKEDSCDGQASKTDLFVDVGSGLSEPLHAVRMPRERSGVRRRLFEAARGSVHLASHLHQMHHTLQLRTRKDRNKEKQ